MNPGVVLGVPPCPTTASLLPSWAERLRGDTWVVGPDMLDQKGGGTTIGDATAAGKKKLPDLQAAIDGLPSRRPRRQDHRDAAPQG